MIRIEGTAISLDVLADAEAAAAAAVSDAAQAMREEALNALERYGIGHGALADSLTVEEDDGDSLVVAAAPHARFVEFGTTHIPPRPFLTLALDSLRGPLTRSIADRIAAALGLIR